MRRSVGVQMIVVMGLGCVVISGCATGVIAKHPDFKSRQARIHAMTILPPKIDVYKLAFNGDRQEMYDLLAPITSEATEELQTTLTNRGYNIRVLNLNDDALRESPELKRSLQTIRDVFNTRISEYQKRWFPAFRQFTYSLGSEVNIVADHTKSDALVIVQCTGLKKTGGEITKDITQSALIFAATLGSVLVINHASATVIQLAVVDGDTGDILWYADNSEDATFDIADEPRFRGVLRNMMSQFPNAIAQRAATTPLPSRPISRHPTVPSPTAP